MPLKLHGSRFHYGGPTSHRKSLGCFLIFCIFVVNCVKGLKRFTDHPDRGLQTFSQFGRVAKTLVTFGRLDGHTTLFSSKGAQYAWQARVERATGTAHSLESSYVPSHSELFKALNSGSGKIDFKELANVMFGGYPLWLCRFPVTFGLLQAVTEKQGSYQIKARPFGIQILNFGVPYGYFTKFKNEQGQRCADCMVVLPITGGIMSLAGPHGDRGALRFSLRVELMDGAQSPAARMSGKIETAISGYRPKLCGSGIPTNKLRADLYLGSQAIVHAYIMWRFHLHCRRFKMVHKLAP